MTLTTIPAIATGNVWTAAQWTTYLKDNINDQKAFADGTTPFPGATQKFGNDANFSLSIAAPNPVITFDSGDYIYYQRSTNSLRFAVGTADKFVIDSAGKIQTAFFESTEQTITNGSTANIAHGLASKPRLVLVLYGTATGASNATRVALQSYVTIAASCRVEQVGGTNIVVINDTGVTVYAYAFALL